MKNSSGSIPKTKGKNSLKGKLTPKNPGELDNVIPIEKPIVGNSLSTKKSQNFTDGLVAKFPGELDPPIIIEKPIENGSSMK
jgi:hypothetical protein